MAGGCRSHKAVDHEEAANRKHHLDTPQQQHLTGRPMPTSTPDEHTVRHFATIPIPYCTSIYPSWNPILCAWSAHTQRTPTRTQFFRGSVTDHIDLVPPYSRPGPKPRPPAVCASGHAVYAIYAVYAVYAVYARARLALTIPTHGPVELSGQAVAGSLSGPSRRTKAPSLRLRCSAVSPPVYVPNNTIQCQTAVHAFPRLALTILPYTRPVQ